MLSNESGNQKVPGLNQCIRVLWRIEPIVSIYQNRERERFITSNWLVQLWELSSPKSARQVEG